MVDWHLLFIGFAKKNPAWDSADVKSNKIQDGEKKLRMLVAVTSKLWPELKLLAVFLLWKDYPYMYLRMASTSRSAASAPLYKSIFWYGNLNI